LLTDVVLLMAGPVEQWVAENFADAMRWAWSAYSTYDPFAIQRFLEKNFGGTGRPVTNRVRRTIKKKVADLLGGTCWCSIFDGAMEARGKKRKRKTEYRARKKAKTDHACPAPPPDFRTATPMRPPTRPGGFYAAGTGEKKFVDQFNPTGNVPTLGYSQLAFTIPQGATATSRTGNSCIIDVIHQKFVITPTAQSGAGSMRWDGDFVRIMLIRDRANNSSATPPTAAQVLDTTSLPGYLAYLNLDQKERFDIVKDEMVYLEYNSVEGGADATTNSAMIKWSYRPNLIKNAKQQYTTGSTSGAQGTMTGLAYFLLYVSRLGNVDVEYAGRCRFHDG
jgi:hypothetical protein